MGKGMNLEECVSYADECISENGECLLLFDVDDFKRMDSDNRYVILETMMEDFNQKFDEYFPVNNLATKDYSTPREEKGFQVTLGDGSWAGINSSEVIPKIIEYQRENYPDISLSWGVARDGYDNERLKLVR